MKKFNDFVLNKHIDQLAEKCVREDIPIVEFVEWYEEEGQYLPEVWGNIGAGAATGAGVGAMVGGLPGAAAGALAGGVYGAGKGLYDKWQKRRADKATPAVSTEPQTLEDAQNQAAMAIQKLKNFTKLDPSALSGLLKYMKKISTPPPAPTPAPAPDA